jgi:hypothetical protein
MNLKPIAGIYMDITKSKVIVSLVSKGTSMLDLHPQLYKQKISKRILNPYRYLHGYNQAKVHLLSRRQETSMLDLHPQLYKQFFSK